MNELMDAWRNENGTFNGIKMLADLTQRSTDEVVWIASRVRALVAEGRTKSDIMAALDEEAKTEPWKR